MKSTLHACVVPTREGTFVAYYSDKGLARLDFPKGKTPRCDPLSGEVRAWHKLTERAVQQVIGGKDVTSLPPLDLSDGTDFQRSVWSALQKIACGKTKTYTQIATSVRKPKAA